MPNTRAKKKLVTTPFHIRLIRSMISTEVTYYFNQVTSINVGKYIRFMGKFNFEASLVNFELPTRSKSGSQKIREKLAPGTSGFVVNFWEAHSTFDFSLTHLNMAAQSITFLGKFYSWEDFLSKADELADRLFIYEKYVDFTPQELVRNKVLIEMDEHAREVVGKLFRKVWITGKLIGKSYRNVIELEGKRYCRSIEAEEFKIVDQELERLPDGRPIKDKRKIHDKYPNSFFVILNYENKVIGHLAILPLKIETFFSLINDELDEEALNIDSLSDEIDSPVQVYYVGQIYCTAKKKVKIFSYLFGSMFSRSRFPEEKKVYLSNFVAHYHQRIRFLRKISFAKTLMLNKADKFYQIRTVPGLFRLPK